MLAVLLLRTPFILQGPLERYVRVWLTTFGISVRQIVQLCAQQQRQTQSIYLVRMLLLLRRVLLR
jgi:hypothetical protein